MRVFLRKMKGVTKSPPPVNAVEVLWSWVGAFLGIAAVGAVLRPENVAVSAVVGGIGIVQIVALFYRNPLADIARAVSNAQQAKIALTTYVIGISLIHDSIGMGLPNADHIKSLLMVTDKALKQMQTYIEEAPRGDSSSSSPEK